MSYLALARKWRPNTFKAVVGQAHVLTALENALTQNRLHHAYLFSGTRGVGKTTIGRLFAKGLNCETGITATPCGQCATCKEIDQGRFVDLLEIDAASRTKVEDTRELLDNVQYKPARGRFKVYLIDEVHMLSRHSFNALLKTLEEPPEYVKFLLATTDPQKLPVTILSRCLQFHLKPISVENIRQQLEHVLQAENVNSDSKSLAMIAHAADGSMRDALSLTDQAIALGNGVIEHSVVSHMLGTLDTDQALHLLQAISSQQPQIMMACIEQLASNGVEWDGLLQQLATQLHRIAMCQALPSSVDKAQPDTDAIEHLAKILAPQDVQLYYQIVLKGRADLPLAPTARIGIEMVALRMMAFRPTSVTVSHSLVMPTAEPVSDNTAQRSVAQMQGPVTAPATSPQPQVVNVQPAMKEPEPPVVQPETRAQEQAVVVPPVAGLRHQLRSQRQGLTPKSTPVKKPDAVSAKPTSILDRVAQRAQSTSTPIPPNESLISHQEPTEQESVYQWRPSTSTVESASQSTHNELTPTQIKRALEHEKTPEMIEKLIIEAAEQDSWAKLISQLETAKLVEQLALNSTFHKQGTHIELTLRPSHAHLNTDKAQSELLQALNDQLQEECHLSIHIGESGETPLELRERLYQAKLTQALESLKQDTNVQFIERRFHAQLDHDSVRPV
ncbi:DNA polymerase III subunit gamma/tau [Vibrio metschnikovii]|uniref:DNA polymerase III subunit gamma/tau n=1 Tax=Vibrio metschnikovii TaxID=28172 RepID=UPI0001B944BE|nr:DNA polymerase III subunit gamma/tau [Vibrio metschnikovii]EEX36802.1 DNA polymerase III subunits gamma and tau [Vibrio metschnikovii CIP 69.14]SUP09594.1 DNA polymerase III subunits gamma and tau [Vibrio metschnikovii]SUP50549.1 DNA polymerase III subunits gamma and tau [Vibrio metschnikovii]